MKVAKKIIIGAMFFPSLALAQWDVSSVEGYNLPGGDIATILGNFLTWALEIFGILAVLAFIISGVMYLTAAGNTTQIETAKKAMQWSIIGVVVGLSGVIVLNAIQNWLGGSTTF